MSSMQLTLSELLKVAVEASHVGGEILLSWRDRITAREKSPRDLVTEADIASQAAIRRVLLGAYPDHAFIGEEDHAFAATDSPAGDAALSDYRWIVDPLDGTANYVHGLQSFAVSIGLQYQGQIVAGVVYDPILRESFTATRGGGAFLNGKRIATSGCQALNQAMVAASFAPAVPRGSYEITQFIEVLHACQSVRRLGSAALNLCYVASGRLDAYWTSAVKSWDVAAGILMVAEAGGAISNMRGGPFDVENPELIVAASTELHRALLGILLPPQNLG